MCKDVKRRFTCKQALAHSWFVFFHDLCLCNSFVTCWWWFESTFQKGKFNSIVHRSLYCFFNWIVVLKVILFGCEMKCFNTLVLYCRISGNAALSKDIHASVSAQMKKNFAKSRWKVRLSYLLTDFTHISSPEVSTWHMSLPCCCCCCCCYHEPVRHCLYGGTKRSRRDEEFHQTLNLEGSVSPSW